MLEIAMLVRPEPHHPPDVVDTVAVLLPKQVLIVQQTLIKLVKFADPAQLCRLEVLDRTISHIAAAQAITI